MIIPIRCFTCGKVLADKYDYYVEEVAKLEKLVTTPGKPETSKAAELKPPKFFDGIKTKEILDNLKLTRYCCRRHMISTVDMMDTI